MTGSDDFLFVPSLGQEVELTMHDGTVRDLCFLEDTSNKSSLLISGGAGDCKIYVTDCATGTPFQALSGHSGHVLTLYNWGGAMFVSGSHDKTVRFWDLRTRGCVNMVTPATVPGSRVGPIFFHFPLIIDKLVNLRNHECPPETSPQKIFVN